jgi:hypothetical protein
MNEISNLRDPAHASASIVALVHSDNVGIGIDWRHPLPNDSGEMPMRWLKSPTHLLALGALLVCAGPSAGQNENLPQVDVQAQRQQVEQRAHTFVERLTRGDRFYGESVAMWRVPLCFLVAGLVRHEGELVLGRLSADADSAGMRLAAERCHPNFFVLFASEPDSMLKDLKARHPGMLGTAGPTEINHFLRPTKSPAVRIWHNADVTNRYGIPLYEFGGSPHQFGVTVCEVNCVVNFDILESRLYLDRLIAFASAIIVVDKTRAKNATLEQLADYIALVGFADIDPDEDVGDAPTILHLFAASAEPAPPGLTAWDRAFLSGLYHTEQSSRGQRWAIGMTVARTVAP